MTTALEYNIDLAVEARKVLMLEANSYEECMRLVYEPTLKFLREFFALNPVRLVCLRGPVIFPEDGKGSYCDLDIVGQENRIAYIGTIRDQIQAMENWQWFLKINHHLPDRVKLLKNRGPMAIIRHRIRCDIPVPFEPLSLLALENGLRKFLKTFLPQFDSDALKVVWLDRRLQQKIERHIRDESQKSARPQTDKERCRIFGMDTF